MSVHMKNIFKSIIALSAAAFLAVSCDVENIGTMYSLNDAGTAAASFVQKVVSNVEIPASTATFDIPVGRSDASGAATFQVESTLPEGMCPSSISFAAGQFETNLTLDLSDMPVGAPIKGNIVLSGDTHYANDALSVTLAKAYSWTSIGMGQFLEYFWEGFVGDVEILKADGFDVYRVLDPYAEAAAADTKGPDYIQFEIVDKANGIVHFDTWTSPYDYDGSKHYVKAYRPSEASSNYAEYDDYSLIVDNYYVALLPYMYIDGVGGWNVSAGYCFGISLPGAPMGIYEWFDEQGLL